ncbi:Hypothetical_protein [Hexamita inflata]|uniref:Hypothetical_protein n=1 Tax=Hexamita inflata TaxID=28002 RepID=A0AA86V244_9EUKA|nr:Hypothetical protein HINF_LOCUS65339 [Hexamita inflata]
MSKSAKMSSCVINKKGHVVQKRTCSKLFKNYGTVVCKFWSFQFKLVSPIKVSGSSGITYNSSMLQRYLLYQFHDQSVSLFRGFQFKRVVFNSRSFRIKSFRIKRFLIFFNLQHQLKKLIVVMFHPTRKRK